MMNDKKSKIISILAIFAVSCILLRCNNTRNIDIRCRPLNEYQEIVTLDYRTLRDVVFDSIKYKEYLLSFSDTTDDSTISGVFLVEKCYRFDKGIVLIAGEGPHKYEIIVITDDAKKIVPHRYYKMRITRYFYFKGRTYNREVRKAIYHKHYVIYPAYILNDEGCICTAELEDIVPAHKDR